MGKREIPKLVLALSLLIGTSTTGAATISQQVEGQKPNKGPRSGGPNAETDSKRPRDPQSNEKAGGDQSVPERSATTSATQTTRGSSAPGAGTAGSQQPAPAADSAKRGEWLFAPIPINSPAIGAGLAWAVGYIFPFSRNDKVSPPSMVGIGGLFTNNGSRGLALGGRFYLKEDKYRITAGVGNASVNVDFFGAGKEAGDRGIFIPINVKGSGFIAEFLLQVRKRLYVGARAQYRNLRVSLDREEANLPDRDEDIPDEIRAVIDTIGDNLFRQKTVAIGPRVQFDTRDNTFYPTSGVFLDSGADFFAEGIGSKFTYQYYKIAFNKYVGLKERHIVAFRAMGCAAAGDRIPFYDLCLFGTTNDLRGYPGGRFQDRRMFATQAEYRFTLPNQGFLGRFGLVGFAGVGGVDSKFTQISINEMLPSGGAGVRFKLTKSNPINFRVDVGFGRVGHTVSIGVFEAF